MDFYRKKKNEKEREIGVNNPNVNRLVHYSNILLEEVKCIKDNGIKDWTLLDSAKKIQEIGSTSTDMFL